MDVTLPGNSAPISGSHPVVIIGPNGVGKTRLGVTFARSNEAERVAALRNVEIADIPMMKTSQASREVKSALQQIENHHWRQSFELQNLMAEIVAEDRDNAVEYRNKHLSDPSGTLPLKLSCTRLSRIVSVWNRHFPGRQIKLDYEPTVERRKGAQTFRYPIAQMSEGERTALYLIARVVSCNKPVILVDEPETFFHPLLARSLWDDLEAEARGLRFIYITHDIPFALSRKGAQFAIARSEDVAEVLPSTADMPRDVVAEVLGAASFSISASRLIFCEGLPSSLDLPILSAWHNCEKTAIVPVGGCEAVRQCVSVFRETKVTQGHEAFGYIDRDGWPDPHLSTDYVRAHPVSEIEGIFALEAIFKALAIYNGKDEASTTKKYEAFLVEARGAFTGATLNKHVLVRAKQRVEIEQRALLNPLKPSNDLEAMRQAFGSASPAGGWPTYLASVFEQEEERLRQSLAGSPAEFVRDFPAKSFIGTAAKNLGYVPGKMIDALCGALRLSDEAAEKENKLRVLRDSIVPELAKFLWPRRV